MSILTLDAPTSNQGEVATMIHKGIEITNTSNNPVATDICKKQFTTIQQRILGLVVYCNPPFFQNHVKIYMLDN
jgi:tRNA1(Val) A37 N6-methylase TrmN6